MNTSPFTTPHLSDLGDPGRVLHNDSWALALAGHAREIALRRPGAGPDLVPLARITALLYACRHWGNGQEKRDWDEVSQEFRQWTGPGYLNPNLALGGAEGAELAWLEARYAATGAGPTRLVFLRRYLEELREARFRSGELRRQYQHTYSAVLLDLQRIVDKLTERLDKQTNTTPARSAGSGTTAPPVPIAPDAPAAMPTRLYDLEAGPTRQATQTYFRTVFRNHVNLLAMADQKAAIMISVNALLIGPAR